MVRRRTTIVYETPIPPQGNLVVGGDPGTGPALAVSVAEVGEVRIRLTLEVPASRSREALLLFQSDIENPNFNEPILLVGQGSTPSRDMAPVRVRMRLLSGSAANLKDAILSIRLRRRRRLSEM